MMALMLMGLAACTSPDSPTAPPVDTTATRTQTLATLISTDTSLSAFSRALAVTGLRRMLYSTGPYTVFAPTDAAFQGEVFVLDTLSGTAQRDSLRALLAFHIVRGRIQVRRPDSLRVSTLHALPLLLRREAASGMLRVKGHPVHRMVEAQNGLLYVISAILHPTHSLPREASQDF